MIFFPKMFFLMLDQDNHQRNAGIYRKWFLHLLKQNEFRVVDHNLYKGSFRYNSLRLKALLIWQSSEIIYILQVVISSYFQLFPTIICPLLFENPLTVLLHNCSLTGEFHIAQVITRPYNRAKLPVAVFMSKCHI